MTEQSKKTAPELLERYSQGLHLLFGAVVFALAVGAALYFF